MMAIKKLIDRYSWLLRLGMWIGIVCWSTQVFELFPEEDDGGHLSFFEAVRIDNQIMKEIEDFSEKIFIAGEKKGVNYSAVDYYTDLKTLEIFRIDLKKKYQRKIIPWGGRINQLQGIMLNSRLKKDDFEAFDAEWDRAAGNFDAWLKDYSPEEFQEIGSVKSKKIVWDDVHSFVKVAIPKTIDWIKTLYKRGGVLAIFLFLLRMRRDQGVLKTFLCDKKKFVFAILFWPINLFRYPFNVVGEIVVEAELRRLGGFFRKLSSEERKLVRKVAESRNIFTWIRQFRAANGHLFERSFAAALLAVLVVNFVYCGQCEARDGKARDGTIVQCTVDNGHEIHKPADSLDTQIVNIDCVIGEMPVINFPLPSSEISFFERIFRRQEFAKQIDHIPLFCSCAAG